MPQKKKYPLLPAEAISFRLLPHSIRVNVFRHDLGKFPYSIQPDSSISIEFNLTRDDLKQYVQRKDFWIWQLGARRYGPRWYSPGEESDHGLIRLGIQARGAVRIQTQLNVTKCQVHNRRTGRQAGGPFISSTSVPSFLMRLLHTCCARSTIHERSREL